MKKHRAWPRQKKVRSSAMTPLSILHLADASNMYQQQTQVLPVAWHCPRRAENVRDGNILALTSIPGTLDPGISPQVRW